MYKIYHWDTFDNETIQIGQKETLAKSEKFVEKKYKGRISFQGADKVDIVDPAGTVVKQYSVK